MPEASPSHPGRSAEPWREVLERALHCAKSPAWWFAEEREDLVIAWENGEPRVDATRSRGLASGAPGPHGGHAFLADADPDDVERWPEARRRGGNVPSCPRPGSHPPLVSAEAGLAAGAVVERAVRSRMPAADVSLRWIAFVQRVWIAHPDSGVVSDERRGERLALEVRHGGGTAVGEHAFRPGNDSAPHLERLGVEVVERSRERREARPARSGEFRAVFAPGTGGVLVHELIGHALEGDVAARGLSWLVAQAPELPSILTIADDPRRGRAAWRIDDEGERARATSLVQGGRVGGWLVDDAVSRRCARPRTGHARRASFRDEALPRMGCTFVAPGEHGREEVLEGIDEGIYVRRMETARADPLSGRASFLVTDADRIESSRLAEALDPFLIEADARTALSGIDRIAGDLAFDTCIGSCLRRGQAIATSVGGPTFRTGLITVVSRDRLSTRP